MGPNAPSPAVGQVLSLGTPAEPSRRVHGERRDQGYAHVLAEIVRLDHAHHRQVTGDSPMAEAVKLLARAQQSLIWDRTRQVLRLRSTLREFFPAALQAFDDLAAGKAAAS